MTVCEMLALNLPDSKSGVFIPTFRASVSGAKGGHSRRGTPIKSLARSCTITHASSMAACFASSMSIAAAAKRAAPSARLKNPANCFTFRKRGPSGGQEDNHPPPGRAPRSGRGLYPGMCSRDSVHAESASSRASRSLRANSGLRLRAWTLACSTVMRGSSSRSCLAIAFTV
jgi:hypothetical protein